MATDTPTFRLRLLDERAAVEAALAAIDITDEEARFDAAETALRSARVTHNRAARRWAFVQDKRERLTELDAQIELVTP